MQTLSLRDRRRKALESKIAQLRARRESAVKTIIRIETTLPGLERQLRRYDRPAQKSRVETTPATPATPTTQVELPPAVDDRPTAAPDYRPTGRWFNPPATPPADDGMDIPEFMRRGMAAQQAADGAIKDAKARQEIQEQQAAEKKHKASRRIEKLKISQEVKHAELTGARRRWPLTGKEAVAAIKGGR